MKHSAVVVLGVAASLVTGCGSGAQVDVASDFLVPGTTMAARAPSDEELHEKAFLDYVRRVHPGLQFTDGDRIVTIAKTFCRMYDQGGATEDAKRLIRAADGASVTYTYDELTTISGSGVAAFCPEHVNKLRRVSGQESIQSSRGIDEPAARTGPVTVLASDRPSSPQSERADRAGVAFPPGKPTDHR